MTSSPITVLCVDEHNLVRECVIAVIEQASRMRVVAEARTVKGAVERFLDTKPDVTVVSLQPRGLDNLQAIREIRRIDPGARIAVYARSESEAVYAALEAGATGFVLESAMSVDLIRLISDVHARNGVLPDDLKTTLEGRGEGLPTLTCREVEILELFTQGFRTKAVAAALRISDHTVKVHMKSAYEKLGVHGRAAALTEALRRGFVRLAPGRQPSRVTRRSDASPLPARGQLGFRSRPRTHLSAVQATS
jgi:DNA-binding NarL/FixJ family response regulator